MSEIDPDPGTPNGASEPKEPIDRMIISLRKWLDDTEAKLEQAADEARMPDDIPCFLTRYEP